MKDDVRVSMAEVHMGHLRMLGYMNGLGFLPEPNYTRRYILMAVSQIVGTLSGMGLGLGLMWLLGRLP